MGYTMLAATARRVAAAAPLRTAVAQRTVMAPRGFATVSSPRPLSFRMDGLFAQCMVAAVLYFAPQDIILFGGLFAYWHKRATTIAPKAVQQDAAAALEEFKAKKGIDKVNISKGRSTWYVSM